MTKLATVLFSVFLSFPILAMEEGFSLTPAVKEGDAALRKKIGEVLTQTAKTAAKKYLVSDTLELKDIEVVPAIKDGYLNDIQLKVSFADHKGKPTDLDLTFHIGYEEGIPNTLRTSAKSGATRYQSSEVKIDAEVKVFMESFRPIVESFEELVGDLPESQKEKKLSLKETLAIRGQMAKAMTQAAMKIAKDKKQLEALQEAKSVMEAKFKDLILSLEEVEAPVKGKAAGNSVNAIQSSLRADQMTPKIHLVSQKAASKKSAARGPVFEVTTSALPLDGLQGLLVGLIAVFVLVFLAVVFIGMLLGAVCVLCPPLAILVVEVINLGLSFLI